MFNSATAVLKGIKADWFNKLNAIKGTSKVDFMCDTFQSKSNEEKFYMAIMSAAPQEWIDQIDFTSFKDYSFTITNKKWQKGIMADRDTIADSNEYMPMAVQNGIKTAFRGWAYHKDKLINDLLVANPTAFDGTAFFADSRGTDIGSNLDNIVSTGGVTIPLLIIDLGYAYTQLSKMVMPDGTPYNEDPSLVVYCPAALANLFRIIETSITYTDGSGNAVPNPMFGRFRTVVNYHNTTTNVWYLINESAGLKPVAYLEREAPVWEMKDDNEFTYVKYWTRARYNVGVCNPMSIIKVG